ncbi:MAG: substrate-binding domain-containing protein [Lachnospiraceae bacterium]|nr:substrate-binding domain-containing protein [Lachnospiraceae bacterium]
MSKRILMLTSTWDGDFTKQIIAGVLERIGNDDIEVHIFNAYDTAMEADFFRKGREIYKLPSPENYDGLIIALSTVESVKYVNDINEEFRSFNKPVVSIDIRAEGAIFCGLDNYRSMYQIVEHMITIHDCRTFNYLGGPEDNEEAIQRYKAFCDCLESHGIRVDKKRVLHRKFWKSDGREAYREWKERGVGMADAVICANDFMALGYTEEALNDGISIPDYIKVTGFDNIDEAQRFFPSITSVNRNRKALGYESMDALLEAINGNSEFDTRFIEGYINYNESCGCDLTRDLRNDYNNIINKTKKELETGLRHSYARQILFKCRSMEDYDGALRRCNEMLELGDLAICLNKSFFEEDPDSEHTGFDDEMFLYYGSDKKQIDRKHQMYPSSWEKENRVFLFASLRSSVRTHGYVVMPYRPDFFERLKHRTFVESLALSLHNINLRLLVDRIKQ